MSSSFTQRFSNFVTGSSSPTTVAQASGPSPDSDLDCPSVSIRQGAATYAVTTDNGSEALSLRYQASFVRFARGARCGKDVTHEGRRRGPGHPRTGRDAGQVAVPVRLAVVKEGLNPQVVWTKFYMVPVTLQPGEPFATFTQIEEDMTFPMPPGNQFDQYVIYVGFDPQSASAPEPKLARQAGTQAKPRPAAAAPPPPQ